MVFGLFSKERSLQKTIERATNKLAQQIDRQTAMDKLREEGTDEALLGLCKRFGITSMKGVEDESEKNWVVDVLVEKGAAAIGPLRRYMKSAEQLSFPLRALERIAPHDKVLEIADELFESEPPGYVRMPERRIDLLRWITEWKDGSDDEIVSRVAPYVVDFDENSRFSAIDGISTKDVAKIGPPLIAALLRPEEESGRIRRTIVEILERRKVPLGDKVDDVTKLLVGPLADFKVADGIVKKR